MAIHIHYLYLKQNKYNGHFTPKSGVLNYWLWTSMYFALKKPFEAKADLKPI